MPRTFSKGGYKAAYAWDRPRIKRATPAPVSKSPEQLAEERAKSDAAIAEFIEQAGWNKPRDALGKIIDREARVAVEGDTDLNHDNVEGAE